MTNFLTQYPDMQGVMAANDSMALGVVKALDAAGKSGKIKVVGFDNIPAVQPLIKSGKMLATIEQYGAGHGGDRHQLRPAGIGRREIHRLGQDAREADHGQGPCVIPAAIDETGGRGGSRPPFPGIALPHRHHG